MPNPLPLPEIKNIIYALDIVGVIACTIAATVLAKQLKLDFWGAVLVSFLGSVGGGTLRDLLINRHPIFWLHDLNYLYTILLLSTVVQMFYGFFARINHVIRWFDALGLAAFTIIGVEAALSRGMTATIAILMGAFTAVIGGVMPNPAGAAPGNLHHRVDYRQRLLPADAANGHKRLAAQPVHHRADFRRSDAGGVSRLEPARHHAAVVARARLGSLKTLLEARFSFAKTRFARFQAALPFSPLIQPFFRLP